MKRFLLVMIMLGLLAPLVAMLGEQFGFRPCKLCIIARYLYLILVGAALLGLLTGAYWLPAPVLLAMFSLSLAHVGLEQGWWHFDIGCTSALDINKLTVENFYEVVSTKALISCDVKQPIIWGVSFADLNLILSVILGGAYGSLYLRQNR